MGKKSKKYGQQERQRKASERQVQKERGCQDGTCQSMDTALMLRTRNRVIRLCRACAIRRGYCLTCSKKRDSLQEGTCAACWAKIQLGVVKQEEAVNP